MKRSWRLQLLVCAAMAAPIAAQPAYRVADINTASAGSTWVWPHGMEVREAGGRTFFGVSDGIHGTELWATDGTAAGTALVADICPGICGAGPFHFARVGKRLYFTADDGAHGREVWVSDGTRAGTRLVADIRPGLAGSEPHGLAELGGRVLFTADDGVHGKELWASDGTAQGTVLVADIAPGATGSSPVTWQRVGARLIFAADDQVHGFEPWATDGTAAGTLLLENVAGGDNNGVADLAPDEDDSTMAVAAGRLFFTSTWGGLWTTDGTPAGTVRIEAIDPASFRPWSLVSNGAQVFFLFDDKIHGLELWASDGTEAGTRLVRDIWPGEFSPMPWDLTVLHRRVYFHAKDPVRGRELWVSDGTTTGTVLLKDVNPDGDGFPLGTSLHSLRAVGGRLLFFADDGTHGNEPWASDGTPTGTALVADLRPGAGSSYVLADGFNPDRIRAAGGRLYFRAMAADESFDVWSSDGTAVGTARLARINVQASAFEPLPSGRLRGFRSLGAIGGSGNAGRLLFSADDGASGSAPWVTDGTAAGTARLPDLPRGLFPHQLEITPLGDLALFQASTGTKNNSVWATDGTPAGTVSLSTIDAELSWLTPLPAGGAVVFSRGMGLVRSDGTPAGTAPIPSLAAGEAFTPLGTDLIFRSAGHGLRVTDGVTPSRYLKSFPGIPNRLTAAGPLVFFTTAEPATGRELWKTDGTRAGTVLVEDILPGPGSGLRQAYDLPDVRDELFASLGGRLIFTADTGATGATGEELWTSDGTEAGTVLLRDVFPGPRSSEIRHLTTAAGRVFFVAEDGVHGRELWATDGTAAGTRLVADLRPGPGSALPRELTEIDGLLLFAAEDGVRGVEPWTSDGTAAGTGAIQDIAPGLAASSPLAFTPAGPNVYFVATDGTAGFELWALPRAALSGNAGTGRPVPGSNPATASPEVP